MTKREQTKLEAKNIIKKGIGIKPSSTLQIVIKSVSKSGMSRRMRVYYKNRDITHVIAQLTGLGVNDTGLLINGCGMDMTFWLADYITYHLYGHKNLKSFKGNGGSCINWVAL